MIESTSGRMLQKNTFPLRIFGKQGERYLACPFELTYDDLELSFLNGDPRIAHFQVVSTDENPGFKRHFLYSGAEQRRLVTSSGYLFTGNVAVYYPRAAELPKWIRDDERRVIAILSSVELLHVHGDEENETGGLDNAVAEHMRRIDGLKVDNLRFKEAMEFYNTMKYYAPRQ